MSNAKKPKPVEKSAIVEIPTGLVFLHIEKKVHHING